MVILLFSFSELQSKYEQRKNTHTQRILRNYLKEAVKKGCVIFWLPEENKLKPRPLDAGPYATDTRGEIGRWSVEQKYNPEYNVVLGAEENFFSLSQIKRNWIADQDHDVVFTDNIIDLVDIAVEKAGNLTEK